MYFMELRNEALKDMCWWNKCFRAGKSCGGYPGSTAILERSRRHVTIDVKSRKLLVYVPPRQRIINTRRKFQKIRSLATSRACREQMEDVDVL